MEHDLRVCRSRPVGTRVEPPGARSGGHGPGRAVRGSHRGKSLARRRRPRRRLRVLSQRASPQGAPDADRIRPRRRRPGARPGLTHNTHTNDRRARDDGRKLGLPTSQRHALRVDERIIDPAGSAAFISLVLPPPGVRLPFDDLAVQQARRQVLAGPIPDAVSTLLRDDSHFEGAITVARSSADKCWLTDDPFGRIFPARVLAVDCGILGSTAAPTGPTIERYGTGNPWPWDQFS